MSDDNEKTFVYEGKEWSLTGRTAKKNIYHVRKVNQVVGTMTILEIAPTGVAGSDPIFYKWVDPRELFFIEELPEDAKESTLQLITRVRKANNDADRGEK
ncbi:hypothetical protein Xoosp13_186 [Xanthomonas phage Xoo-sp13]|nr:hypothetical protein Xoosp13_186 [Xanthomonas phage Xoo-sp13]